MPVEFRLQDYRDLTSDESRFDAISPVGMIEHVGCKNYYDFMKTVNHCLKPDALFLLHTRSQALPGCLEKPLSPFALSQLQIDVGMNSSGSSRI